MKYFPAKARIEQHEERAPFSIYPIENIRMKFASFINQAESELKAKQPSQGSNCADELRTRQPTKFQQTP